MNVNLRKIYLLSAFFTLTPPPAGAQIYIPDYNLVMNSDFMSGDPFQRPLHWVIGAGLQTVTISNEEKHSIRKDDLSLKISDSSVNDDALVRTKKIPAAPGVTYKATSWAKARKGRPAEFTLEFWDQNDKITGSKTITPSFDTAWQKLELFLAAPDRTTHVTVSVKTGNADTGISFWDDFTLKYEQRYDMHVKKGVREMFMDDYRIERLRDVQRVIKPGVKSKVLINPDKPWEGRSVYIYGTILKDKPGGTGYKMWYTAYKNEKYYLCYATSKDGLTWLKPNLGIIDFEGNKNNNICMANGGTLLYDPYDKDLRRRYKLMRFEGGNRFGYHVFFSPDGLHWSEWHPGPVLPYGDVSNIAFDTAKKMYIATTKQRMYISNTSVTPGKNDRTASVSVSTDFINWHAPDAPGSTFALAVEGDPMDDYLVMSRGGIESNIYGMPVYPYQGMYIGFPWMFDITTYNTGEFSPTGDGKIQPQLAVSRDLKIWERPLREPILPLGIAGSWDDGTLYTASNMLTTDKEMIVYYGAMNLPHGGSTDAQKQYARIASATWRTDGFAALKNGGDDEGEITTKAITFNGSTLKVNCKLNHGGYLKVEISDEHGNSLMGYDAVNAQPITGDRYDAVAAWINNKSLKNLAGQKIKLRFYLKGGELYSYWFE